MSLLGRKRGQEGLESLREESGWGSALGLLTTIEVLEDLSNHARVLDEGQSPHWMSASRTDQRLDFVDSLVDVNVRFSGRKRSFIRRFQRQNLNVGS